MVKKIANKDMFFGCSKNIHFQVSFENGKMGALTHLMITYRGGYVKVYKMGF